MFRSLIPLLMMTAVCMVNARETVALIGTYTRDGSEGIYAVRIDGASGALTAPELVAVLPDPEFLARHPNGRFVYALTKVDHAEGDRSGAVAAFEVATETGRLTPLNVQSALGGSLTHLAVSSDGRMLVAAGYGSGEVVSFPLLADGSVGPRATVIAQRGPAGPNESRQQAPHPHSVTISPDDRIAFVADLGIDRVVAYALDHTTGEIAPHDDAPFVPVHPGAGPRHTVFSSGGHHFYILNELDGTITACRYDGESGTAEPIQRVSTSPDGYAGRNSGSEIRMHPSGRFVYAANRGHNGIAVFARNVKSGKLDRIQIIPTGGKNPRNFALSPDGNWLLCANQNSHDLTVFSIDQSTGALTATPHQAKVPRGVCVLFLPPPH